MDAEKLGFLTDGIKCRRSVTAKELSSYKGGGNVDLTIYPQAAKDLYSLYDALRSEELPYYVIGGGTNTLISDNGYDGALISTKLLKGVWINGNSLIAGTAEKLPKLALLAAESSLSGLQRLSGIPGTIGGALVMNAGAFGAEIAENVATVTVFDIKSGKRLKLSAKDIPWGYRSTGNVFKNMLITSVELLLMPSDKNAILSAMQTYKRIRRATQPTKPSLGSVFKKTADGISAGYYIDRVGLKGMKIGGAEISPVHANFIVNNGEGTAKDFLTLAEAAETAVKRKFRVALTREINVIGEK